MKKVIFALAFAACTSTVAFAQMPTPKAGEVAKKVDKNAPKFEFIGGETHDFGNLTDQKNAEYVFRFKNVGKTPLIISNASASCGCTVPEFPKEPILPGKVGQLKVTYNTAGKSGPFDKAVYIQSNAPSNIGGDRYELHIKGSVTPGAQTGSNVTPKG
jgi:archaellum component FlaG (FlaF/FlaG flagellin family)